MTTMKSAKNLGQIFLRDNNIAKKIVNALYYKKTKKYIKVIEVGPGKGILTQYLLDSNLLILEIDSLYVNLLTKKFPTLKHRILNLDVLRFNPLHVNFTNFILIGNFPYSISSQILFYILKYKDFISECIGMFPKEVGERIVNKNNQNLSGLTILIKSYFKTKYLFTVNNSVFSPKPKIKSAVIKIIKRENKPNLNYSILHKIVKTAFNQRRKKLKTSLKYILFQKNFRNNPIFNKRVEQLSVKDFTYISRKVIIK
ncbi:16S rRNA (adenine(1518)-N(6)/adenine(1519)-N(6))-dimethyltransferase RsmA [Candidatus Karelsulcia muelleri]